MSEPKFDAATMKRFRLFLVDYLSSLTKDSPPIFVPDDFVAPLAGFLRGTADGVSGKAACSHCAFESGMCEAHRAESKANSGAGQRFAEQMTEKLGGVIEKFGQPRPVDLRSAWLGLCDSAVRGGKVAAEAVKVADNVVEAYRARAAGLGEGQ